MNKHVRRLVVTFGLVPAMMASVLAMGINSSGSESPEETSPVSSSSSSREGCPFVNMDIKELQENAEKGIADAQYHLGVCYGNGEKIEKNLRMAADLFLKAATQEHARAQFSFGVCCYEGDGVAKNLSQAFFWFLKAAEQGIAVAQFNVGTCYRCGEGVEKDLHKAFLWFLKAAKQGNSSAINNVEVCYRRGDGVEQDSVAARGWSDFAQFMKRAEETGPAFALASLLAKQSSVLGVLSDDFLEKLFSSSSASSENENENEPEN